MTTRWFIGLGSNLGDRLATLRGAIRMLGAVQGLQQANLSRAWATRPLGPGSGPYLNAAVELVGRGPPDPEHLLDQALAIERAHGRIRRERWGDRTLDIDLLCCFVDGEEFLWSSERLVLPHRGVLERDFVLRPLLELDADLVVGGVALYVALGGIVEPTLIMDAAPIIL